MGPTVCDRCATEESRGVIVKHYKGPLRPGISIDFYGGGVCYDAPYEVGAVHVVYAKRLFDGRYSTDCTRTHVIAESTRDIEFLERFCLCGGILQYSHADIVAIRFEVSDRLLLGCVGRHAAVMINGNQGCAMEIICCEVGAEVRAMSDEKIKAMIAGKQVVKTATFTDNSCGFAHPVVVAF
jgi:hypothetical protein